jgi:hypothetical protein
MPWRHIGSGGIAPHILKFGIRWRSGQLDAPAPLSPKKVPPVTPIQDGGPQPLLTIWGTEISLSLQGIEAHFLSRPCRDLVTIPISPTVGVTQFNIRVVYFSCTRPILVATRSKAWVCGRSPAGIVGSNPTGSMDVCLLSMFCVVRQTSLSVWSLVLRSPTECGVSGCDREASIMRPWPTTAVAPWQNCTIPCNAVQGLGYGLADLSIQIYVVPKILYFTMHPNRFSGLSREHRT